MIETIYFERASTVYNLLMQVLTAYFFYRFCRIFIAHRSVIAVAFAYLFTVLALELFISDLSNFGVYLAASLVAFLLLLPLKSASIYLKLFLVMTYFSVRWMAPTIVIILYRPINAVSLHVIEKWLLPTVEQIDLVYYMHTICMMICMLLFYSIALWLVLYFYGKYMRYNERVLANRELVILMIPALIGMSSYFMMNQYHRVIADDANIALIDQFLIFWGLHNLIILFAMFSVLLLIQKLDIKRREQQKQSVLVNQAAQLQQHLQSIDALDKEMQRIKHDVNNHFSMVERLIEQKQFTEATHYLEGMQQQATKTIATTLTGNAIVDLLMQEKMKLAQQQGVTIEQALTYPQHVLCDVYELCIILHNALDNAIAAAKLLPGAAIAITSLQHKTNYLVTIKNPHSAHKKDDKRPGLGLQIIRDVARKYNGDIAIEQTENQFELTIYLHLQSENQS